MYTLWLFDVNHKPPIQINFVKKVMGHIIGIICRCSVHLHGGCISEQTLDADGGAVAEEVWS